MGKKTVNLINGTHWDREWRHTAEQSKLRLVDLMDSVIDVLETKESYQYYCIDGGTIVLEDYLSIKPEMKTRIKKLIKAGKLIIVNWYTLPETNTVAPESLIRNLLWGHQMAKEFGGGMNSGYTATSYGQPSQLPQLYRGFKINNAIFYRGTNKHILTPLFRWRAPDGSEILTLRTFDEVTRTNWFFYVHGPAVLGKGIKDLTYTYDKNQIPVHMADLKSYEKAFTLLHEDFDFIHNPIVHKKALDDLLAQAEPYKIGNEILALNLEDNDEPYLYLPELIEEMNKVYDDVVIKQVTMDEYMDKITKLAESGEYICATHKGELRNTTMEYNNFNALLGATHSSRIKIKILNDDCENNLIYLAEPLASFAKTLGINYPTTNIDRAWEYLLKCHAHDSICGAAVDRAHEDMMYNFSLAKTVAEEVTNRSVIALYKYINTKENFKEEDHTITIFNTLPFEKDEVVELVIDTPEGVTEVTDNGIGGCSDLGLFYDIVDNNGCVIPSVELSKDKASIAVERKMDTKAIKFNVERRHILVKVKIPSLGYATFALRPRGPIYAYDPEIIDNRKLIARSNGILENAYLKIVIHSNGTFDMIDKCTKHEMKNLHYFSDSGEVGSAHVSLPTKTNCIYTSLGANAQIDMLESNELRGIYRIRLSLMLPEDASIDGHDRSRALKELKIESTLSLEKDSHILKINTKLDNQIRDHKLCVNFPTYVKDANFADSESAWDIASRTIKWRNHLDNFEGFFPFQPMQNFVDISDGNVGFAFFSKGLREYEVEDDQTRILKITLIRTQRAYMTANSRMTKEELDKYTGQHSFGKIEYEYAIYPHKGNWFEGNVLQKAYAFKVPLKAVQGVPYEGDLPDHASFIAFEQQNKSIMISAIKQSVDGNGIIFRIWNVTQDSQNVSLKTILPLKKATHVDLDEQFLENLVLKDGLVQFILQPKKIYSIKFEL
ncbi:MAG: alpha-mannosidase [Candidatus Izemoplasmatales bacterium]|jgi:mannosylglycerate hydrolase